jgi:enamine deaminase RidA (YjgF/YER057c/UK114 family)
MIRLLLPAALLLCAPAHVFGQTVERRDGPAGSPILTGVIVPPSARWVLLSGQVPPVVDPSKPSTSIEAFGDTEAQTVGVFRRIETLLKAEGLGFGDVVKLTVFLVGDPKLGGRQDFKGFSAGYARFFGTAEQPNKVARSTVQVAGLVNPGWLVEIEAIAVKLP